VSLITYQLNPGVTGGSVNQGGGQSLDIGAAITAGGGVFTIDDQVNPQLVYALDRSGTVHRSGVTPGTPVTVDTIGPAIAHSNGAPTGVLQRNADGTYTPTDLSSVIASNLPPAVALGTQAGANAQAATGPGRPSSGRTSTLAAPVLRDVYSLDDQAGATADGANVTLTMASGNATPTSCSVTMTSADAGKAINVPLNGGGLLATTIASVSGGVPTLAAAPSAAATATVGWYGTDNTTPVTNLLAVGAAQTARTGTQAKVVIPSGAQYVVQSILPVSNVTVWGYGATLLKHGANLNGLFSNGPSRTALLTNFRVYGLNMTNEYWTNGTTSRTSAVSIYDSTGCTVKDSTIQGFYELAIGFSCARNVRIKDNTITNCAVNGVVSNAISVTDQSPLAWSPITTDVVISGNTVVGALGSGICLQCAADITTGITPFIPFNARVDHNNLSVTGFAAIALEIGGITAGGTSQGSTIQQVTIDHNILTQLGTAGGGFYGIQITDNNSPNPRSASADETGWLTVDHNIINSSDNGISTQASHSTVDHNIINAVTSGIAFISNGTNTPTSTVIADNVISLPSNASHGIQTNGVSSSSIQGNRISYPTTSTSGGDGMHLSSSSLLDVRNNTVNYAPANGFFTFSCSDVAFWNNKAYNVNTTSTAGASGFFLNTQTAVQTCAFIGNEAIDDRGTPLMAYCLNISGSGVKLSVVGNVFMGQAQASPLSTLVGVVYIGGNRISNFNNFGTASITVGASPFTYTNGDPCSEQVVVAGGTGVSFTYQRGGGAAQTMTENAPVILAIGDKIVVTYTTAPTIQKTPML
jgi:hypothetical protein